MSEIALYACPDCGSAVEFSFLCAGSYGEPFELLRLGKPIEIFLLGMGVCKICYMKTGDRQYATVRLMYDISLRDWCEAVKVGIPVLILTKGDDP